ncbi:G2/mitotic-specific cyclin 3 [Pyrenophora tritici-repentis]|nr:G2/mitotic-specific cyclin 3 [Pyrenophora tritici-repentis]
MRDLEERMKPDFSHMESEPVITWSMRKILVKWLLEISLHLDLPPEVLFLAVNYLDRYLSRQDISKDRLQLAGCTALFIAAKYEGLSEIDTKTLVCVADEVFTAGELLQAEKFMLTGLNYELGWPSPISFLLRVNKADDKNPDARTVSKCLLDITLIDKRFVVYTPSFLSAGAYCLARFMLGEQDWSPILARYSGYTLPQLRPLVSVILDCCEDPPMDLAFIYELYSRKDSERYLNGNYKRALEFVQKKVLDQFCLPWEESVSISLHTGFMGA